MAGNVGKAGKGSPISLKIVQKGWKTITNSPIFGWFSFLVVVTTLFKHSRLIYVRKQCYTHILQEMCPRSDRVSSGPWKPWKPWKPWNESRGPWKPWISLIFFSQTLKTLKMAFPQVPSKFCLRIKKKEGKIKGKGERKKNLIKY